MKNILPVLTLLSYLVCGQITTETAVGKIAIASNWEKLDRVNYSIRYPANWDLEQKEDKTPGVALLYPFTILSPIESSADKFRENVNLVIEQLAGRTIDGVDGQNIDLDKYAKLSTNQLKLEMSNFQLIETKTIETSRHKYYKTIFTWDYEAFKLKVEQYYWITNGKAYVLTFTSERDKFSKFSKTGEKILNTFTLKGK
jgi:eukaryotic-like serine/threonine-protein kinase